MALLMTKSLKLIQKGVKNLYETLKNRALEHKDTLMVGRSHGVFGEPITFGLVLALFADEIKRHLKALDLTMEFISVGAISGAMGNFAHAPLELEELACEFLGLKPPISAIKSFKGTATLGLHAIWLFWRAVVKKSLSISAICNAVKSMKWKKLFQQGKKGALRCPHKRNPILSENITGLCRVIRSLRPLC